MATSTFVDSKPRYALLDGLRGVAALLVICYHVFEGFATSVVDQGCNHGYLAVDFFFLLSGFVIGYAYDDRLGRTMTLGTFFKRRLIRLHPMVIVGAIIGAITFLLQGSVTWNGEHVALGLVALALLMNFFMLPQAVGATTDVRGNGEMFPLNGPNWSLFFEYIGNILYALVLRWLKTWQLAVVVVVSGAFLAWNVLTTGYLGVGWSFVDNGFAWGLVRMMFPYSLGMLMARIFMARQASVKACKCCSSSVIFWLCAATLVVLLPVPYIGSESAPWQNGLYVLALVLVVFPAIVWCAAKADGKANRVVEFLGNLSYPLYMVHYPVMYLFYHYIGFPNVSVTLAQVWHVALGAILLNLLLAWLTMKFIDMPVRKKLAALLLKK